MLKARELRVNPILLVVVLVLVLDLRRRRCDSVNCIGFRLFTSSGPRFEVRSFLARGLRVIGFRL